MTHDLKKCLVLACTIGSTLCSVGGLFGSGPKVKFTLEVVDEKGLPVSGALTILLLTDEDSESQELLTDEVGHATVEGRTNLHASGGVTKNGYYETTFNIGLGEYVPDNVKVYRRLPDVLHRVVLRPVVNPVPMYAYQYFSDIPVENQEIGFDFLETDWVAPYGKGVTNDVLIRVKTYEYEHYGPEGGEFCWRFPRPGDGMVRVTPEDVFCDSDYRLPRIAPEGGYIADWTNIVTFASNRVMRVETLPPGPEFKRPSYILRIRSDVNGEGVVTNALYGKIIARGSDGIGWSYARCNSKAEVDFTYYVNPDGTRNLESDPRRNLFRCRDGDGHIERRSLPDWP